MNSVKIKIEGGLHTAETKERILDAAERLFAERGFEATSTRDITGAAGVNLGSVNYHFKTKQQLINTIFLRRVEPVNQRRLALLAEIERKAGHKPPTVEALVEALIRPAVPVGLDQRQGWETFLRLAGRFFCEPNRETNELIRANMDKVMSRFMKAFLRALPGLPRDELLWRLQFTLSGLHHLLLTLGNKYSMPSCPVKELSGEEVVRRMVSFAVAGIKAQRSH